MKMIKDENGNLNEPPIHGWFGLTYANYFVVPRLLLQEQSLDWQNRFIDLMDEIGEQLIELPEYHVLRAEDEYTMVTLEFDDDDNSNVSEYTPLKSDPWSNYKRGNSEDIHG